MEIHRPRGHLNRHAKKVSREPVFDDAGLLDHGRHHQGDHYWHCREQQGDAEPKPNHANDELTLARGLRVFNLGL